MPAIDDCEPQMIRALEKSGWRVIDHPLTLRNVLGRNHVYADLRLEQIVTGQQIIVVEVNAFPTLARCWMSFIMPLVSIRFIEMG
jgi:hypothetical protein